MNALSEYRTPYEILVTDDDENCRETVGEALRRNGYRPHLAGSGQEAIEYVRRHFVHAIIVDMNMPDLTGVETVMIVRNEMSIVVPSILISADTSPELRVRALTAHFETFVPKPLDLNVLRHVVHEILRRHYETD